MVPRSTKRVSRRTLVAGLAAGALIGAAFGVALLSGAGPHAGGGPAPEVLHAAPAIVDADTDVKLGAATVCDRPDTDRCRVTGAAAFVRPAGATGWSEVEGRAGDGGFAFTVPAQLVPPDGFAYWLRFTTASGTDVRYPPGGQGSPLRVLTTVGLPSRQIPGTFSWDERRAADGVVLRLRFGRRDGRVGRTPEQEDQPAMGPSSFDVASDGSLDVVDWVNRRIEVFSASGSFMRAFALPGDQPMDIALRPDGGLYLAGLGMGATVYELDAAGRVTGRYPVGFGVSARISATTDGPRVFVGPGQWTGVSLHTGVPLSAEQQSQTETSYVALADGSVGVAAPLGSNRFAAVWTRPDGSRAGALVRLPHGVRPGTDYFVRPTPDGGAVAAEALWDDTHMGVGLFRFGATGTIEGFSLLPEPSTQQDARFSTVRFRAPGEVLVAYESARALTIQRFEVT
jgi:hypothetical protein